MKTNYTEKWQARVARLRDDVLLARANGNDPEPLLVELDRLAPNLAAKLRAS